MHPLPHPSERDRKGSRLSCSKRQLSIVSGHGFGGEQIQPRKVPVASVSITTVNITTRCQEMICSGHGDATQQKIAERIRAVDSSLPALASRGSGPIGWFFLVGFGGLSDHWTDCTAVASR